ncbi:Non-specific serine/threonine protein kinase [Bertholletia excelsa]
MAIFCINIFNFKLRLRRKHRTARKVNVVSDKDNPDEDRFEWDEVERIATNFSQVIGSGGFSTVYLARLPDSTAGAIKIYSRSSERLNRIFKQELDILIRLRHDNIVKLLGYSDLQDEGAIVFEYVPNGTLQEKLHGCEGGSAVISWQKRWAIAFQLIQAIEYLHEKCTLQIVHGDIKSSNILLDNQFNCKLCDFGSAKMGFSSTVLPPSSSSRNPLTMLGSPGYVDPHYLRTGIASKKNDVYSFGVIVLELITGMEAFNAEEGRMLTSSPVAAALLRDHNIVAEMVDPHLNGHFDLEEAKAMASIAAQCLQPTPSLRPSAADILIRMKAEITSIIFQGYSYSK